MGELGAVKATYKNFHREEYVGAKKISERYM